MCGILGGIDRNGATDRNAIRAALEVMKRRGPDAQGVYELPPVFLGHRRLSIIDLDARSDQPLVAGQHVITFNGEIYNYRAIRKDLEGCGISFRTESDTEVALAAYRHEGLQCLQRFEGMFAFAIWDSVSETLTLVRDRFGEKPLVYFQDHDRFLFASEVAPLEMLAGREHLEVDQDAISLYFQLSYIPAPMAPYRGMRQLEPGTWLQIHVRTWSITTGRYYELRPRPQSISLQDAADELQQRLDVAVRQRMLASDVPVATFLSGGVDSSIISALAAKNSANGVRAYSIGFPEDPAFDESPFARMVAQKYPQIDHTVVDVTERQLLDFTDQTLSALGEPYADSSLIPTAFLCAHVEEKVILGGDGADEIFAGYGVYDAMRTSARLPRWVKQLAKRLPVHAHPHSIRNPRLRAAALFLGHLRTTTIDEYLSWRSYMNSEEVQQLGIIRGVDPQSVIGEGSMDTLAELLALDMRFNLPNDMLKKVDLASMQHGLEVRLPYLDSRLVSFALSLPEDLLLRGRTRKHVLKYAFRRHLPNEIFTRRKQGFLLPVRRWFSTGQLGSNLLDLSHASNALDRRQIGRLLREHQEGRFDHSVALWSCYAYLKWASGRKQNG